MAENNRPRRREQNVTGQGAGVHKRGDGENTGPVGNGRPGSYSSGSGGSGKRNGRAGGSLPLIAILLVVLLGGGGGLSGLLGGSGGSTGQAPSGSGSGYNNPAPSAGTGSTGQTGTAGSTGSGAVDIDYLNSLFNGGGTVSSGWSDGSSLASGGQEELDTTVASGARDKYTKIRGGGQDKVTLMVYMCGTDLESRSGMGTSDLQEMIGAKMSDNVNILVYTGGCKSWRNNVISSSKNQVYQVVDGGLSRLVADDGSKVMTDPATLSGFIQFCAKNFPADRYDLILWDHGAGSASGYGYDEKNARSGSMSLAGINTALKNGGVKFDFVGFDACLMATMETALMLDKYADYMIASEETEPGVGWYYTDWLTTLSKNTSISTAELGRQIVDDFVNTCARKCPGQKTTLSVVDLAELSSTAKADFTAFSNSVSGLIENKEYRTVANARNQAREFAASNRIDQVDLVHLAENMGTAEGKALGKSIRAAVKYNRTSTNMTNAYGLSIYFPYKNRLYIDKITQDYDAIGIDAAYAKCIRQFASLQASGQAVSGGNQVSSPYSSLFGDFTSGMTGYGSSSGSSGQGQTVTIDEQMIGQLLGAFLGGDYSSLGGLSGGSSFLSDRAMPDDELVEYLTENHFDGGQLYWTDDNGQPEIRLTNDQWGLVQSVDANVFYDDGEGYVDLGRDLIFDFDEDGNLVPDNAGEVWISINDQPVAYYHLDTVDDGENYTITGRVPCKLNDVYVNLILVFDNEHPHGYIAGAVYDYRDGETETVAKSLTELTPGDTIDFLCDYYSYDGDYQATYMLGEQQVYSEDMKIHDTVLGDGKALLTYRFTDIYYQEYWSETLVR